MNAVIAFLVAFTLLTPATICRAADAELSAEAVQMIEMHASPWNLVLKREQLKTMANHWRALTADPDSATAFLGKMMPVADSIVDQLVVTTGYTRGVVMRWLEADVGLSPYFFPPLPQPKAASSEGGVWKFLTPIVPVILYRVVDGVLD